MSHPIICSTSSLNLIILNVTTPLKIPRQPPRNARLNHLAIQIQIQLETRKALPSTHPPLTPHPHPLPQILPQPPIQLHPNPQPKILALLLHRNPSDRVHRQLNNPSNGNAGREQPCDDL